MNSPVTPLVWAVESEEEDCEELFAVLEAVAEAYRKDGELFQGLRVTFERAGQQQGLSA